MTAPAAGPRALRLQGAGGIGLAADAWGDAAAPPLLLLHGGGQTRGAWSAAALRLAARGWHVIAPDLRGHGESDWSADGDYSVDLYAADVRALISSLRRPPVLIGASLGGLSSLLAAGESPRAAARALVLVDVAHRPEAAGVARIIAFMTGHPEGFASLEEAAAAVAAYLPQRATPERPEGLQRNLRRRGGRWVWHWDPRLLEHFAPAAAVPAAAGRLIDAARAVAAPIFLVRGALSDVISPAIAREFCELVPGTLCVGVAGAGHMVAGDRNDRFVDALLPFLDRLDG